jgi:hypothetical protein
MSDEGLPQGLGGLFRDGGPDRRLDVDLPPGRLIAPARDGETGPAYWLSDEPAGPDLWVRLRRAHARSGLWPVIAAADDGNPRVPWAAGEVSPQPSAAIDALDAGSVLARLWDEYVADGEAADEFAELEPFGQAWPGPAAATETGEGSDPAAFADQYVGDHDDGASRLLLAPAARSADVVTVVGWQGSVNHTEDTAALSSVLRSWEDRFGIRVIELGFDILAACVPRPPTTMAEAERVAAEHFAFCPDNIIQGAGTIAEYAASILGEDVWSFWWD